MKVILNQDVKHLGEEGDIKDVATGYARNFLFPRNFAVPCNEMTKAFFEGKRADIEARKDSKRAAAASLRERIEATTVTLVMPAGANGKLYGAVTNQTIVDELTKLGFEIERKRVELPGLTFKSVGKYNVTVHLYEQATATLHVVVEAQPETERSSAPRAERPRRRHEENDAQDSVSGEAADSGAEAVTEGSGADAE